MPPVFLGEGKGLADKASDALAQGVVPAFHVRGLLADTAVSLLREDRRIGFSEVTEAAVLAVGFRHPLPKCPTGGLAVVAVGEGHDLAGSLRHITVQSQRLFLRRHTNDQASSSSRTSLALAANRVSLTVGRLRSFFSHRVIVLRVIPKVRLSPRSEERS